MALQQYMAIPSPQSKTNILLQQYKANSTLVADAEMDANADLDAYATKYAGKPKLIPSKNVVMCSCAKCGSSSLYAFVYQSLFGKAWNHTDFPYIQIASSRWQGQLHDISEASIADLILNPQVFSFALVRDPRERLISAWKSKIACQEDCWHTNVLERQKSVADLLALANKSSESQTCMSFGEFVKTLYVIHGEGKQDALDVHFRPQHLGCFKEVPAKNWSIVAQASDYLAAKELAARLGKKNLTRLPYEHASGHKCGATVPSPRTQDRLAQITQSEYVALGIKPLTSQGKDMQSQGQVLQTEVATTQAEQTKDTSESLDKVPSESMIARLERLWALRTAGAITDDETEVATMQAEQTKNTSELLDKDTSERMIARLERLWALRIAGTITDGEFVRAKKKAMWRAAQPRQSQVAQV